MTITGKPLLRNFVFISLFIALFGVSCTSAEKRKARAELKQYQKDSLLLVYDSTKADPRLDSFMQRLHHRSGFNGNVLIAKGGKILYQNAFGWANYLLKDRLMITSQSGLASISKPKTATGILTLWEEGKIKLEHTVDGFFPEFPYAGVTIIPLPAHRSALMNYLYFTDKTEIWPDK